MFRVETLCQMMSVSRAGFYAWCKRPESPRKCEDKRLSVLIQASFQRSRRTYGYRRLQRDLIAQGENCGKGCLLRLMRDHNIQPKMQRKFKVTTDSNHQKPIYENHLERQFHALKPNQRWVSDITYIPT